MKGFSLNGRNLGSGLEQTSCQLCEHDSSESLFPDCKMREWCSVIQGIHNFKGLSIVLFLLFHCYAIKNKKPEKAPFNLPLFKGLWEMKVENLSSALRLQTDNGRNGPESLLTPVGLALEDT